MSGKGGLVRRLTALVLAALLIVAVALPVAARGTDQRAFVAVLKGESEVPAVQTDGFGLAVLGLNRAESALGFLLIVAKLENIVQAHIHCGAPGVNGPVVAFLFGPAATPVTDNGVLSHGVIRNENVIPRPDSPECPGGVADFNGLIAQIRAGNAYVNVHTTAFPMGEIRGQVR
jgi:hypothetical protein